MAFSITQDGKELSKDKYTWDEKTRTLSTTEDNLVLDFSNYDAITFITGLGCTFKTGYDCTFKTGSYCTFETGDSCTFDTGSYCTSKTGYSCTFKTGYNCTFDTGLGCTFKTGYSCTFKTGYDCTFKTGLGCTFKTGYDCTFKTGSYCTFDTGDNCTFETGDNCTFNTGSNCTFKTGDNCIFDTSYNCTFDTGSGCMFDTGSYCTVKTSSNCTFDTDSSCTFNTGSDCTFKTSWDCTFKTGSDCVVVRREVFEVIKLPENETVQLCPHKISGYVKDGYYYKDDEKQYKAIIADGILSEIINHKGNVYKVKNYGSDKVTYLVQDGDIYSHGDTLKEARESLVYKISNRDTSVYNDYTLDTELTKKQAIKMYRIITGACEGGTRHFVETHELPSKMTVKELIELTKGQYGNDKLAEFMKGL